MAEKERYIRTLTISTPEVNQIRKPADFTRRASATSSRTSPCTAAWPPMASYTSRWIKRNWPLAAGVADGIIHFIKREFLCEAKIDERNERFFVPGLQNLFRRKRNHCGGVFAAQDQGFCDRAFGKNGIGVSEE